MMEIIKLHKKKRKALVEGNKSTLASVCIDIANHYMLQGDFGSAAEEFEVVAKAYKDLKMQIDYARAERMVGEAYMQLSEYTKALDHQKIHLDVARQEKNEQEEQRALATIGHTYLTRYLEFTESQDAGDLKMAAKMFRKSLKLCENLTGIGKTEHMDMMARLFTNLGIVEESQGNYAKALGLIHKSIDTCNTYQLYEQLERNYVCLASLFIRQKEHEKAIEQYNLAIEVAKRLPNKNQLMATSLAAKADILVQLGEFRGAKSALLKAYKKNTCNKNEAETIITNLKTVAAMCNAQESILTTDTSEHKIRKTLYEKLGDGSCHFKNYSKALEYYQKMLEEAELSGEKGKALSPCYISLAQTYRDLKDYTMAIYYFYKDYEQCEDNVKESVTTLLNIVETMELQKEDSSKIDKKYREILSKCSDENRLKTRALKKYIQFLKAYGMKENAALMEKDLESELTDSETCDSEEVVPNVGDEISISDITDVSAGSDSEQPSPQKRVTRRRREKGFAMKRNLKGETPLHVACIDDNEELVRRLIAQGHPVNERDNCGWLPLHEACNRGYVGIVKVLLDNGANINDRGGVRCGGVTPLYDASSNGHFDVIQLLMDRGASIFARTDEGHTALDILKQWRFEKDEVLDPATIKKYEEIVAQMTANLEKSGHRANDVPSQDKRCGSLVVETKSVPKDWTPLKVSCRTTEKRGSRSSSDKSKSSPMYERTSSPRKIGSIRRNLEMSDMVGNSVTEYQAVIDNLKNRNRFPVAEKKRKSEGQPPLVTSDADDWLEDDLGSKVPKRRKTKSSDLNCSTPNKQISNEDASWSNDVPDSFFDDDYEPIIQEPTNSKKAVRQSSLIRSGFTRRVSDSSETGRSPKKSSIASVRKKQTKLTNFTAESEDVVSSTIDVRPATPEAILSQMLSIDVRIENKLYRVPVASSEVQLQTVRWLADEAAKRYFKREGAKPTLELETKNGAILADEDLICMLFPAGAIQGEEVIARVLKLNIPTLTERYVEACSSFNTPIDDTIQNALKNTITILDLSDHCLRCAKLEPLCFALNRQTNLIDLNLSGNIMTDTCINHLCRAFPSLTTLTSLNLSLNNLTVQALKSVCDTIGKCEIPILQNLSTLDLSYNPFCDESFPFLAIITRYLRLQKLRLAGIKLSKGLFRYGNNENIELYLENLSSFDIGGNALGKDELLRFVSWMNLGAVECVDFSGNDVHETGFISKFADLLADSGKIPLKLLDASDCNVEDEDILNLLRVLENINLANIKLGNNNRLTSIALFYLLNSSFVKLDLLGCKNIVKNLETNKEWTIQNGRVKELLLSLDPNESPRECALLRRTWRAQGDYYRVEEILKNTFKFYVLP